MDDDRTIVWMWRGTCSKPACDQRRHVYPYGGPLRRCLGPVRLLKRRCLSRHSDEEVSLSAPAWLGA